MTSRTDSKRRGHRRTTLQELAGWRIAILEEALQFLGREDLERRLFNAGRNNDDDAETLAEAWIEALGIQHGMRVTTELWRRIFEARNVPNDYAWRHLPALGAIAAENASSTASLELLEEQVEADLNMRVKVSTGEVPRYSEADLGSKSPKAALEPRTKAGRIHFHPLRRIKLDIRQGVVVFELDDILRGYLDADRRSHSSHVPYAQIDLRTLAAFKSSYSAPLYRFALARSIVRIGGRLRPHVGRLRIAIDTEQFRERSGYSLQQGGARAQLRRSVLAPLTKDFERCDEKEIVLEAHEDGKDYRLNVGLPLPPLNRLPTLDFRNPDGSALTQAQHVWAFGDLAKYRVSSSVWLKAARFLSEGRSWLNRISRAWLYAIDEIESETQHTHGALGDTRRRNYRSERLMESIEKEGVDRTAILFAIEEWHCSDLADEGFQAVADANGLWKAVDGDRRNRLRGLPQTRRHIEEVDEASILRDVLDRCETSESEAAVREILQEERRQSGREQYNANRRASPRNVEPHPLSERLKTQPHEVDVANVRKLPKFSPVNKIPALRSSFNRPSSKPLAANSENVQTRSSDSVTRGFRPLRAILDEAKAKIKAEAEAGRRVMPVRKLTGERTPGSSAPRK